MRQREPYSKEELQEAVANSKSFSDVFRNIKTKINGGSYGWLKRLIKKHDIDTSHFMDRSEIIAYATKLSRENRGKEKYETGDVSNGERIAGTKLRYFMQYSNIETKCSDCGISEWRGMPIRLDIDHVDGNPANNHINNLQYLCPNCHRQKTIPIDTHSVISKKRIKNSSCADCGKSIYKESKKCMSCSKTGLFKAAYPPDEELQKMLWETPSETIAKALGVSGSALKKYTEKRGLTKPPRGYWSKKVPD